MRHGCNGRCRGSIDTRGGCSGGQEADKLLMGAEDGLRLAEKAFMPS